MTIYNLGSINADLIYSVPHLPGPGETLAATGFKSFLGGKGCNMSVAAARAGAHVAHIGAIGPDGQWAKQRLTEYGVDTRFVDDIETATGQAIIAVAEDGENNIILYPGANRVLTETQIGAALSGAEAGDWFVTQNETNMQANAAKMARELGLKVAYAAAPFEAAAVEDVLQYLKDKKNFLIEKNLDISEVKKGLIDSLKTYDQFAIYMETGDIVAAIDEYGDLQVNEYM